VLYSLTGELVVPKGRAGISGPGVFYRVRLPKEGQAPKTDDERKLLAVAERKDDILSELSKRIPKGVGEGRLEERWDAIIHAVGGCLGKRRKGLPPTVGKRDRAAERIRKAAIKLEKKISKFDQAMTELQEAAAKLEDGIETSNFHVEVLIHRAMHRRGADFYELKKHLAAISDNIPMSETMPMPKERPDPYLEDLIRELIKVWADVTGKIPGKTGTDHYQGGRTSPFYRWCNMVAEPAVGKKLPRDLLDAVIDLHKAQVQNEKNS
jgi:hypothetical protein